MSKQLGTAVAFSVMTMAAFALFFTATPHAAGIAKPDAVSAGAMTGAAGNPAAPSMFSPLKFR
ncbi:hypothetical protein GRI44_08655 [Altererythrobacter confluentis]|uniref:Uncharacterized protein n=1 Tax=Allopontixanthobacter confluentis TaxID=1849021 RepID=A0A6L7GHQ9_9SPHN|nr:hypothetical protein [Allopontixanthobacter confluentis]MXP14814.1 hypothetical protein [Allopontixanthobacter confluentis]